MKKLILVAASIAMAAGMATAQAGDVEAGQAKYAASGCVGCHGPAGQGQAIFPKVAGSDVDHLVETMTKYRAGEAVGPNSAMMMPHAMNLSDEDIANLAAYMASMD
nr:c-type cytochrome [Thioalkalivibrio sp.]